jgi:hypothetical protein
MKKKVRLSEKSGHDHYLDVDKMAEMIGLAKDIRIAFLGIGKL